MDRFYSTPSNYVRTKGITSIQNPLHLRMLQYTVILCTQMIRMLKDPEGKTVFTAHEEHLQVTTALGRPQAEELVSLKKKVKQLEDALVEYKVLQCVKQSYCLACSHDTNTFSEDYRIGCTNQNSDDHLSEYDQPS